MTDVKILKAACRAAGKEIREKNAIRTGLAGNRIIRVDTEGNEVGFIKTIKTPMVKVVFS